MTKSRNIGWTGYVACMDERGNAYKIVPVKPKGKRPLGRHRRRWENNIKMDLWKLGWEVWLGFSWL
jgi:hypothetical protein